MLTLQLFSSAFLHNPEPVLFYSVTITRRVAIEDSIMNTTNKIGNILFLLAIVVGAIVFPVFGAWGEVQGIGGEFAASVWCGLCVACLAIPCMGLMHYRPE